MEIVNLTPHHIIGGLVHTANGDAIVQTWQPSGIVARAVITESRVGLIRTDGIVEDVDVIREAHWTTEGLPELDTHASRFGMRQERLYIVSRMVAYANTHRPDLIYPTKLVRDASGNVIKCGAFGTAYVGMWMPSKTFIDDWCSDVRTSNSTQQK